MRDSSIGVGREGSWFECVTGMCQHRAHNVTILIWFLMLVLIHARMGMVKRTTINLDMELVAQAREVLETGNTTETVHAALRDVVRRDRLQRLSEREWDFTLEDLKEMRRSRMETRPWGSLNADL